MEKKKNWIKIREVLMGKLLKNKWVVDEKFIDGFVDYAVQELGKARKEEYEKLIGIFDNLRYDPTGETDLVDKRFILGILKEELSKLK